MQRSWQPSLLARGLLAGSVVVAGLVGPTGASWAADTPDPTSVTIAGSLSSELGSPGDWQQECAATHLVYDEGDAVWRAAFDFPAGDWEYKAALNDSWAENDGANAVRDGAIPLSLSDPQSVGFFYDHETHWITDSMTSAIASAPGSFQDELGCSGDWQPDCLRSWLQDPDGDGVYRFTTTAIPAGDYEFKVALNESWDENYGTGGTPGGDNLAFTVPADGATVAVAWDAATKVPTVEVPGGGGDPGDADLVRDPVRQPGGDKVIYFVMTDRFANGDPSNDTAGSSGDRLEHGFYPTDKGFYHGGDLAGLQSKLECL